MILLNMKREDLAAVRPLWAAQGVGQPDKPGSGPGDRCLRPKAVVEVAEAAVVGPIVDIEPTGFADGFMWNVNEGKESRKTASFLACATGRVNSMPREQKRKPPPI